MTVPPSSASSAVIAATMPVAAALDELGQPVVCASSSIIRPERACRQHGQRPDRMRGHACGEQRPALGGVPGGPGECRGQAAGLGGLSSAAAIGRAGSDRSEDSASDRTVSASRSSGSISRRYAPSPAPRRLAVSATDPQMARRPAYRRGCEASDLVPAVVLRAAAEVTVGEEWRSRCEPVHWSTHVMRETGQGQLDDPGSRRLAPPRPRIPVPAARPRLASAPLQGR